MADLPAHRLPQYSEDARQDALFHYTTATGLIGILEKGELWSTAYFCANDESELATGKGILEPLFRSATDEWIQANDSIVRIFSSRGVEISSHAKAFEQTITGVALSSLCAFITCFCKPTGKEDLYHGLLSQWRGYGSDGGYALQFSRKKLLAEIERTNRTGNFSYQLQDVHYNPDNDLKKEVLNHRVSFLSAYRSFLEELAQPLDFSNLTMKNPIRDLTGGPLESLLDYLIHTKNQHFGEERECRLSLVDMLKPNSAMPHATHFSRNGLIVPYRATPKLTFDILSCVEGIVVGPAPRMGARVQAAAQMVQRLGLKIPVRPSHIPFTRV